MLPALILLACGGDPSVAVTAAPHPDVPLPAPLEASLEGDFKRPALRCYQDALAATPGLAGQVTLTVEGSHGIMKQEAGGGAPEALVACATGPLKSARLQRKLGDGDHFVGFVLTLDFGSAHRRSSSGERSLTG